MKIYFPQNYFFQNKNVAAFLWEKSSSIFYDERMLEEKEARTLWTLYHKVCGCSCLVVIVVVLFV